MRIQRQKSAEIRVDDLDYEVSGSDNEVLAEITFLICSEWSCELIVDLPDLPDKQANNRRFEILRLDEPS